MEADRVFQRNSVVAVRQLVAEYEREASVKDAELRSLVGDSYRDVLASADAIGSIAAQCQKARGILEGVVRLVSAQGEGAVVDEVTPMASAASAKDDYYELASDVKAIVDSQEAMYSYMDQAQFLSAAVRYQEAVALYKKTAPLVKSKGVFPFLAHAWPGIKGLDMEIYEKAKGRVLSGEMTGAMGVADALAACGVLRPVEGVDLLGYYLEGRKKAILRGLGCIVNVGAGENADGSVAARGIELLAGMWETVGVAMVVFGEGQDIRGLDALRDVDDGGEEVGAARDGSSLLIHLMKKRQVFGTTFESSMRVSNSLLQLENEAWLKQIADDVRRDVIVPLLEGVPGCRALREHMQQIEEAERGGRMFGELTWVELSRVATGRVMSLWEMVGREAVIARGKAIVRAGFDVAVDAGTGLSLEAFGAFDAALGDALAESIECMRIDGPVFEEEVASAFGGLMERTMGLLEAAVTCSARSGMVENPGKEASASPSSASTSQQIILGIVQFTSMLQTRSDAYGRLLHVQHLVADKGGPQDVSAVLLPWARETNKRVGAVRDGATRAWATVCAAAILGAVKDETGSGEGASDSRTGYKAGLADAPDSNDDPRALPTPIYPSEWLTRALLRFCSSLEDTVSSQEDLTRLSMETFKTALVRKLQALYAQPSSSSKSRTLQRIYDTTFVNMLSWGKKGDAGDVTTKQMLQDLVTSMDPVEWEEHRTSIETNARRYTHHVSSYLRTSTELTAPGKTDGTTIGEEGNMQLANASSTRFAYLPAKLPSRAPRPSNSSISGLGMGSGPGDAPAPAATDDAFSIAGLQGLAKAKAAEVSDFFSFL